MEHSQSVGMSSDNTSKCATQTRRYWNKVEEDALMDALEALCTEGWNDNGSYRGGYLPKLERMLTTTLPTRGIRHRHIKSKLQGWKKTYHLLHGILGKSGARGASLDPRTCMLDVQDEKMWQQHVVENPEVAKLREKAHPYYHRWLNVWGADHAIGEGACDVGDVMNQLFNAAKEKEAAVDDNQADTTNTVDIEDDAASKSAAPSNSANKKQRSTNKRSRSDACEGEYDALVQAWVQGSSMVFDNLAEKISTIFPANYMSAGREKASVDLPSEKPGSCAGIFEKITSVKTLTLDQQLRCLHYLTQNKLEMEVFAEMNDEARERYMHMLLDGTLGI